VVSSKCIALGGGTKEGRDDANLGNETFLVLLSLTAHGKELPNRMCHFKRL